jgi:multidrug efflux pump subunit AcrA (membrane-fusion protein)
MFGKTKDILDPNTTGPTIDGFFGDETAADHSTQLDALRDRVQQAEQQIHSQFTSMAAYAQIAQEQTELARAESKSETVRTESRLTALIERERTDRLSFTGGAPSVGPVPSDIDARLITLEETVEVIKLGISDCLSQQKALADAITTLFEPQHDGRSQQTFPPPTIISPIGGLALPA